MDVHEDSESIRNRIQKMHSAIRQNLFESTPYAPPPPTGVPITHME